MCSIFNFIDQDPEFNRFLRKVKRKRLPLDSKPLNPVHFIWMGPQIPDRFINNIASWVQHHPNSQIFIWIDQNHTRRDITSKLRSDGQFTNMICFKWLSTLLTPDLPHRLISIIWLEKQRQYFGALSDIYRYLILRRYGGLYSDVDINCYSNSGLLKNTLVPFLTNEIRSKNNRRLTCNSLIISKPAHPIILTCLELIMRTYQRPLYQHGFQKASRPSFSVFDDKKHEVVARSGPYVLLASIRWYMLQTKRPWKDLIRANLVTTDLQQTDRKSYSIGHHQMAASWVAPKSPNQQNFSKKRLVDRLTLACLWTTWDHNGLLDMNKVLTILNGMSLPLLQLRPLLQLTSNRLKTIRHPITQSIHTVIPPRVNQNTQ